jgi:hypothetical protein
VATARCVYENALLWFKHHQSLSQIEAAIQKSGVMHAGQCLGNSEALVSTGFLLDLTLLKAFEIRAGSKNQDVVKN